MEQLPEECGYRVSCCWPAAEEANLETFVAELLSYRRGRDVIMIGSTTNWKHAINQDMVKVLNCLVGRVVDGVRETEGRKWVDIMLMKIVCGQITSRPRAIHSFVEALRTIELLGSERVIGEKVTVGGWG
jgi:hypothetical protein